MTQRHALVRVAPLLIALLLLAAACGSGDGGGGSEGSEESLHIRFAVSGDPAAESLPSLYALDQLEEKYGYTTEVIRTPETSILLEGVATGEFQLGEGATAAILNAVVQGADLKIIGQEANMNWTMVAKPGVETCADLAGQRVGLHAVGSAGEGFYNYWVAQNCTEEEAAAVEILYVAGSDSRVQALQAGQLDAGMITVAEVPQVEPDFQLMIDFAEVLGDITLSWPLFTSGTFMQEHPEAVQRYLEEVVAAQRQLAEDQDFNLELLREYLPDMAAEDAEAAAAAAFEGGLFPDDAGLGNLQDFDPIVDFYIDETGELGEDARGRAADFVDFAPLEEALAAVGGA